MDQHQKLAWSVLGIASTLLFASGCRSTEDSNPPVENTEGPPVEVATSVADADESIPSTALPLDIEERHDTIWSYLAERYDADDDGVVSQAEYSRSGTSFERLDRDQDGALSEADFPRGSSMRMSPRQASQRIVMAGFQADEETNELHLAELQESVYVYDTDEDGIITRSEFEVELERRDTGIEGMLRTADVDAYAMLVGAVDKDGDERVAGDELLAFFEDLDDGDQIWQQPRRGRRGGGRSRPMTGPEEGTVAPDFTLAPPEGGDEVTLSAFEGSKPVALVFGSYT